MNQQSFLELRGIVKTFSGIVAVDNVDIQINEGEIHAIVGENGAGKSTLMKILSGVHKRDAGDIFIAGQRVKIDEPRDAQALGIAVVHQEFNLVPTLSAAENVFLGRFPRKGLFLDTTAYQDECKRLIRRLGVQDMDICAPVETLSVAQQQMVEIAKALVANPRILILDEPTAALGGREKENLLETVRRLKATGITILYISHHLEEIMSLADNVTVMRDGRKILTAPVKELTQEKIISSMVGRKLEQRFPERTRRIGEEVLRVKDLSLDKRLHNVSFKLHRGEILGIAGLIGAGRTDLAWTLFGCVPKTSGEMWLNGERVDIAGIRDAINHGIILVPEDRKNQGLIQILSVLDNITLSTLKDYVRIGLIDSRAQVTKANDLAEKLTIKMRDVGSIVKELSGGNQQKVVLGKWLATNARIFILDEPTRGIDVAAKYDVYCLMDEITSSGNSIIMISSELPELLGVCDRILVMANGKITGEFGISEATEEKIMACAVRGN